MLVLDSDVLVDALHGQAYARRFLEHHVGRGTRLVTTSVNVAEVLRGVTQAGEPTRQRAARDLLGGMGQLPFGPRAAERFGSLMAELDAAGRPLPVPDGMIAAIVLEATAPLVTRNLRHFDRVPALHVQHPDPAHA